jgi:DNA-binding MurR/RpiR family transcriptional regulator
VEQASILESDDLLIAVSFHPYARETAEVVAAARARNARVIAITDTRLSPIGREAHLCFEIKDAEVRQFRSLTASLCLAQTLAISYAYRQGTARAREH